MLRRLLLLVPLACIAAGCASTQPNTLGDMRKQAAFDLQVQCHTYYSRREPQLVYPDPKLICMQLYTMALRGEPIGNWRL